MRRQLLPAVVMMRDLHRRVRARVPARRHRHRAARLRATRPNGSLVERRREGGRLRAHRPGLGRRGRRPAAASTSSRGPSAATTGLRRRVRPEPEPGLEPRARRTPSSAHAGRRAGRRLPRAQRARRRRAGPGRRGHGVGLRASTRTSRSRTRGCRPGASPRRAGCRSRRGAATLVDDHTDGPRRSASSARSGVNVLELNLALDRARAEADRRLDAWLAAGSASTSAPRPASARPSRCSTRAGAGTSAAPTSSSGSSRRTAAPNTAAQVGDLEVVPRQTVTYRGGDVRGDGRRRDPRPPARARSLVDELAHTNVPGSRNEKRWQDVDELLDAGIDVISTVNIQHLESVNDVVERITGIKQQETIPDAVVRAAEQVELVDMTPEALRRRMAHGNIYPAEQGRRLARQLLPARQPRRAARARAAVGRRPGRRDAPGLPGGPRHRRHRGRRASASSSRSPARPSGDDLIRRAARMAQRAHGELIGVHVRPSDGLARPSAATPLAEHRRLLERSRRHVPRDRGRRHRRRAACSFARAEHATQLVLGARRRSRWAELVARLGDHAGHPRSPARSTST